MNILELGKTFRALQNEERLNILRLLHENGRMSVKDIVKATMFEQATISHHLKLLKNADLVTVNPEGRFRYYSINFEGFKCIIEAIKIDFKDLVVQSIT